MLKLCYVVSCQFVNFKQPAVDKRSYHHHHATKWLTTMNKSFPARAICVFASLNCFVGVASSSVRFLKKMMILWWL